MTSPWPSDPTGRTVLCCLCFDWFTRAQLHQLDDHTWEDVCVPCAEADAELGRLRAEKDAKRPPP